VRKMVPHGGFLMDGYGGGGCETQGGCCRRPLGAVACAPCPLCGRILVRAGGTDNPSLGRELRLRRRAGNKVAVADDRVPVVVLLVVADLGEASVGAAPLVPWPVNEVPVGGLGAVAAVALPGGQVAVTAQLPQQGLGALFAHQGFAGDQRAAGEG